jgi:hypothetical protein
MPGHRKSTASSRPSGTRSGSWGCCIMMSVLSRRTAFGRCRVRRIRRFGSRSRRDRASADDGSAVHRYALGYSWGGRDATISLAICVAPCSRWRLDRAARKCARRRCALLLTRQPHAATSAALPRMSEHRFAIAAFCNVCDEFLDPALSGTAPIDDMLPPVYWPPAPYSLPPRPSPCRERSRAERRARSLRA